MGCFIQITQAQIFLPKSTPLVIMKDDMQNQIKVLKKNMMDEWYDRLQKMEMNLRVRLKTRGAKV